MHHSATMTDESAQNDKTIGELRIELYQATTEEEKARVDAEIARMARLACEQARKTLDAKPRHLMISWDDEIF